MQIRREYKTLATIVAVSAFFAGLLMLMPVAGDLATMGSGELDEMLNDRLDAYLSVYENDPNLTTVFATAMEHPDQLSDRDRQRLIAQERQFIYGWELAWTSRLDGHLDFDRYNEWNSWYIGEIQRRPTFVWTENRTHFSEAFAMHVDQSIGLE